MLLDAQEQTLLPFFIFDELEGRKHSSTKCIIFSVFVANKKYSQNFGLASWQGSSKVMNKRSSNINTMLILYFLKTFEQKQYIKYIIHHSVRHSVFYF